MYFTYAIKNDHSKIYIGHTDNIEERLQRHNGILKNKNSSYTHKNKGNWELVHSEAFETRAEAMKREKELKSYKGREFVRSKIKN